MKISDLSYLEMTEVSNLRGSDNSASVSQYASAAAGNNYGYFNRSYYNVAIAKNLAFVSQSDNDYYYPYYYYW